MEKKKMDPIKKFKLIYSGELIIFAIVFIVLGILLMLRVWDPNETVRKIFNILTLVAGIYSIFNFVWILVSPKKRAKSSILDAALLLPFAIFLIGFDIYCFVLWGTSGFPGPEVHAFGAGPAFVYLGVAYIIQGVYHYFHPVPGLFDDEELKGENPAEVEGELIDNPEEPKPEEAPEETKEENAPSDNKEGEE